MAGVESGLTGRENVTAVSAELHIRLLGEFQLVFDGVRQLSIGSSRAESVLGFLLLHQHAPQSRQRLAFLLWPDSSEAQARTNLRHVLHTLRHALPDFDGFIDANQRTLQWRPDAPFRLDVAEFESALKKTADGSEDQAVASLIEAVELYTGDLLSGNYDEWLADERERLRHAYLLALERLADLLEMRREISRAIPYAERLIRHDPLREDSYRLLMRLYDSHGDRARALRTYQTCKSVLERELGIQPSAPTRHAYEALLARTDGDEGDSRAGGPAGGRLLIGRAHEWSRLTTLWRATEAGRTQVVLIAGEPGIGKTRLVEELQAWAAHRRAATARARCYPSEGEVAYGPLAGWLRSEPLKKRLRRLDAASLTEIARLLPELLAEVPGLARPEPLPESEHRQRLFDAAGRAILSGDEPVLLIADDLQWWDRETLRFLHYLLRARQEARLMLAATLRRDEIDQRDFVNDWLTAVRAAGRVSEVDLGRLSREETSVLAERLAGRPLDERDAGRLFEHTEGNPLFIVETLQAGGTAGDDGALPVSRRVQAVIEARLGHLSEQARKLAGVAAAIGRAFSSDVLAEAAGTDEGTLANALDELWRRGIIREQSVASYDFSHDRIRETAYVTLSPALRRHHHLRIAASLARIHLQDPDSVSARIASHYDLAGAADRAVEWYRRAATAAQRLYASAEAVRLLERALELLNTLPEAPERDLQELEILSALPGLMVSVEGYTSSRLAKMQRRAREICLTHGIEPAPPLLRSMAVGSLSHGDFESAGRAGERMRAIADRDQDPVLMVEAAYVLGISAFWSGSLETARSYFEKAISEYRLEHSRSHLLLYGQDPGVVCMSRIGNTLWLLGQPDQARRMRDEALSLADQIDHPYSRSVAHVFAALLALDMRDLPRLEIFVSALSSGMTGFGLNQNQIMLDILTAYLDVPGVGTTAGIGAIRRRLEEGRGTVRAPGQQAVIARVLLAACEAAPNPKAGLAAAEEALATGYMRLWEAEARRLRAEFLSDLGAPWTEVDEAFIRALAVARRQGAKMLELRAAAGLLRFRQARRDHSGADEARKLLAAVMQTISEGHDTVDIRHAARLLGS